MLERDERPGISAAEIGMLQSGLDHINQGITVIDTQLRLVVWNRRFLELLDFPPDLVHHHVPFESLLRYNAERGEYGPGDPDAQVAQRITKALRFEPHQFERTRPDGSIIRIVGCPLPGGGFVTIYTDVTERKHREKRFERNLAERTAALRESEERLRIIANEVPAGIAHLDHELRFKYVNTRFARAYGLTPSSMVGQSCEDIMSPETLRFSRAYFDQSRRGAPVDFEMAVALPSGREVCVRTFLRPDQTPPGTAHGFYLLTINITRQKQTMAALLQAQKMDALGQLSSGIAHDFNNLLTVIIGNLNPLPELIGDEHITKQRIAPALRAARRGADITKRLLTLARKQPLEPSPVNVKEAVTAIVRLLRPSLSENVEVHRNCIDDHMMAYVDPAQLEMALLNLAVNARDAMENGGIIRIHSSARSIGFQEAEARKIRPGDYVEILFSDDGPGMPPETTRRIFEPFFTTKGHGKGSGLGLSMVYGFVRQSNGAIEVESRPGQGARFTILLPGIDSPAEQAEPANDPGGQLDTTRLVLLVDDDAEVRSVIKRRLLSIGFMLLEASDGDEAVELLEAIPDISIVLTDYAMPGTRSGLDLAGHVAREYPLVSVVLMTGHGENVDDMAKAQGIPLLRKPFEDEELARVLSRFETKREEAAL